MNIISKILGVVIVLIAVLSALVSTGLSISYFQSLTESDLLTIVVYGFVILLQSMVLIGSIAKGMVYKKTPQHYFTVVVFTKICFVISVLSTISFFNSFDKHQRKVVIQELLYTIPFLKLSENIWIVNNLTNITLIWLACIILDLMAMYFPSIGSDLFFGISTSEKLKLEKGYVMKLFDIITYYPKKVIDQRYNVICNEICNKENVMSNESCNESNKSCNESYVMSNENNVIDIQNVISNEKPITPKRSNKPCNENVIVDLKKKCNESCNESNKIDIPITRNENDVTSNESNVMSNENDVISESDLLHNIITNIDNYITSNYKSNEKIKVKEIKEKFGLKVNDRRWNDKIRDNLKSCEVINKRLTKK